ncbi:MAG: hypothetical protein ABI589_09480 [Burkholderiales bacterium]
MSHDTIRFEGRDEFRERIRDALATGATHGWREAILCDADFADWPLGEREVESSLHAWAKAGGRFTLIAQRWDEVLRRHARFVNWRERWSHLIECRVCKNADPLSFPSAIWSPALMLLRLDVERCTCIESADSQRRVELRETLEQALHSSAPGFPATTLGL